VADPYATRTPDLSGRPDGPPPWQEEVTRRGGAVIGASGAIGEPGSGPPAFAVIACRGIGTLAPFTSVDPALAVLLWIEHVAARGDAAGANALLLALEDFGGSIYTIKQGSVGGPEDRPGCTPIAAELVTGLLAARDEIVWERDPDFGYQVPVAVPGFSDPAGRVLVPRLLYADHDRVYEHAGLVADKKRERYGLAAALSGLDPTIVAVAGWPPVATGGEWRD
jgi:hypothetical protein